MSATVALNALLWTAALAATIWILVPAIAFALNIGGLRTDVLPDAGPPTVYTEDSVFGPRLGQLAALGFRMESRTRERGRFISPIHWTWESYEAQQWLVSPDGLTHATLYRLAEGEPARISVVTTFEDGGLVRTSCPGAGAKETTRPNYWRFDVRGVDAATLLAKHQEQVEAFARERGTKAKAATVAEIAAADNAAEWPIVRKLSMSSYGTLAFFLLPAPFFFLLVPMRAQGGLAFTPIAICVAAGFYALLRGLLLGPMVRQNAKLSHTRDLSEDVAPAPEPADVTEDGRILATGKNERRLRLLAAAGALLWCVWVFIFARGMVVGLIERRTGILIALPFLALSIWTAGQFAGRARGRMIWTWKRRRDPLALWTSMLPFVVFFMMLPSNNPAFHHLARVVAMLSILVGIFGLGLEKKRGQ